MATPTAAEDVTDRTVHAVQPNHPGGLELVRYRRAGKWYVESAATRTRIGQVSTSRAAELAVTWCREGGEVHLGRPGGQRFDTAVVAAGGQTATPTAANHPAATAAPPTDG